MQVRVFKAQKILVILRYYLVGLFLFFFFLLFNSSKLVRCSMLLKLQLLLLECFSFRPWHYSQYLLLRMKKTLKSQHHSGFLWAVFLWKCRWQKSSLFPSVDLWFVRSWSRILQFLLGPNWPPWLALCKDVFRYGHTTVSNMDVMLDFDLFT